VQSWWFGFSKDYDLPAGGAKAKRSLICGPEITKKGSSAKGEIHSNRFYQVEDGQVDAIL